MSQCWQGPHQVARVGLFAEPAGEMLRVGFAGIQPRESPLYTNFLKRMAELGYQEGGNFAFEYIQTLDIEGYQRTTASSRRAKLTSSWRSGASRHYVPRMPRPPLLPVTFLVRADELCVGQHMA